MNIWIVLVCLIILQFITIIRLATKEPKVIVQEVEVVKEIEVIKEVEIYIETATATQPTVAKTPVSTKDFKSYMPYTAITNTTSTQWQLQQIAYTDENGLRCIDGAPLVAVGTGWGLSVGDSAIITCDNGNSFTVVIGDIKADRHTAADNKTTLVNNCRCEFIVDLPALNGYAKTMGNVAVLEQYSGYVINITKM